MKTVIGAQGEVNIFRIDAIPQGVVTKRVERGANGFVIAHSENGNHHILTGGDVMEHVENVPAGMQIFYAILDAPERLVQDAASPHGAHDLIDGIYEFRISREYNPFAEEAHHVAD